MEISCEVFAKRYLPAVRAQMVKILYHEYHLSQKKVSEIIRITQPAVSQYVKGRRGSDVYLSKKVMSQINENVKKIYTLHEHSQLHPNQIREVFCTICKAIIREVNTPLRQL
ncbi:MAG: transcriptional regulator [Candidatus Hodarchaeota archaeon]